MGNDGATDTFKRPRRTLPLNVVVMGDTTVGGNKVVTVCGN